MVAKLAVYLITCGVVALVVSLIVVILNRDVATDGLGVVGFFGGVAIILVAVKWLLERNERGEQ